MSEILQLTDSEGRAVAANMWQSSTKERVWHVELQFKHEGQWLFLDLVAVDELDPDNGFMLDEDGSLTLTHTEPAPDDPDGVAYGESMSLPYDEVVRLYRWAREQTSFRPYTRQRLSPLAERAQAARRAACAC